MRLAYPTQFRACLLLYLDCPFLFTACRYLFQACHVEMLPTLQLKTGKLPVLVENVQVRTVMFTTGLFTFKYGQFVCMAC